MYVLVVQTIGPLLLECNYIQSSQYHKCLTNKQVSFHNKTLKYLSNIKALLTCHCLIIGRSLPIWNFWVLPIPIIFLLNLQILITNLILILHITSITQAFIYHAYSYCLHHIAKLLQFFYSLVTQQLQVLQTIKTEVV